MTYQHRSNRLVRALAAASIAGALAAPAAVGAPIDPLATGDGGANAPAEPAPAPVVQTIDEGFDWGSAAIGAGGAGALIVLVSAGGFAFASRHRVPIAR